MIQDAHLPGTIPFDREAISAPPRSLVAFVTKLLAEEYEGPQRRDSPRFSVVMPVVAMPLGEDFRPQGTPFAAISRDLSTAGLCLFSTRAAGCAFLAVELAALSGQNIQVVLQVLRCNAVGRFYEIAGPIVARMDQPA